MSHGTLVVHQTCMRITLIAAFLLLSALAPADIPHKAPPLRRPSDLFVQPQSTHKGTWYFSAKGHAIFCYGPTMIIAAPNGGMMRVATFCRGDNTIVPLRD